MSKYRLVTFALAVCCSIVLGSICELGATAKNPLKDQVNHSEDLKVSISPSESEIAKGQSLQLHVEISNNGTQDLLVCRDFESGACDLYISIDPRANSPRAEVAKDCAPYSWTHNVPPPKEDFAKLLTKDWVSIPPKHFYGGDVELDADVYPELSEVGRYRISGRFSSGGPLEQHCYYRLMTFAHELTELPSKSWHGVVETNEVWVRVSDKKT